MKRVCVIFLLLGLLVWLVANPSVVILIAGPSIAFLFAKFLKKQKQKRALFVKNW